MRLSLLTLACIPLLCACVPQSPGLSPADRADVLRYAPGADLDHLTPAQEQQLASALHDGDGLDISRQIASILMQTP